MSVRLEKAIDLTQQLAVDVIVGRAISFLVTIIVTFALNARYTFAVHVKLASLSRYAVIQALGGVLNFSLYSYLVTLGPLHQRPLVALTCGAALGSLHNFLMMRRFVF